MPFGGFDLTRRPWSACSCSSPGGHSSDFWIRFRSCLLFGGKRLANVRRIDPAMMLRVSTRNSCVRARICERVSCLPHSGAGPTERDFFAGPPAPGGNIRMYPTSNMVPPCDANMPRRRPQHHGRVAFSFSRSLAKEVQCISVQIANAELPLPIGRIVNVFDKFEPLSLRP